VGYVNCPLTLRLVRLVRSVCMFLPAHRAIYTAHSIRTTHFLSTDQPSAPFTLHPFITTSPAPLSAMLPNTANRSLNPSHCAFNSTTVPSNSSTVLRTPGIPVTPSLASAIRFLIPYICAGRSRTSIVGSPPPPPLALLALCPDSLEWICVRLFVFAFPFALSVPGACRSSLRREISR